MKLIKVKTKWIMKTCPPSELCIPVPRVVVKDRKEAVYIVELSEKEYRALTKEELENK